MSGLQAALALDRLVQDAALMLAFGASAFTALLAPAGLRAGLRCRLRACLVAAAILACLGVLLWLPLQAGQILGGWDAALDPPMLGAVALRTATGRVWLLRAALALLLLAGLLLPARRRLQAIALLSGLLLASLACVGHAAMRDGTAGTLLRLNQGLHLLSGGAWLGALVPFILCLGALRDPDGARDAALALRRFSTAGHGAVALVLVTGSTNAALILGRWPTDWTSPYQALLSVKILVVATMAGLALLNRYWLVPRIRRHGTIALDALRIGSILEVVLGAAALAAVAIFGILEPV
ncbi:MAG TPA: copper homeostasis membrane protein CopD [Roseomonas sp.]